MRDEKFMGPLLIPGLFYKYFKDYAMVCVLTFPFLSFTEHLCFLVDWNLVELKIITREEVCATSFF